MSSQNLLGEILFGTGIALIASVVVVLGMILGYRALLGDQRDDQVEAAGYHAPWKLALMGPRAPVMSVRAQLLILALLVPAGLVLLFLMIP